MNPVFAYCLALGCFAGISAGAWTLDFEEPLLKAGPSGKVYVNPTGNFRYEQVRQDHFVASVSIIRKCIRKDKTSSYILIINMLCI